MLVDRLCLIYYCIASKRLRITRLQDQPLASQTSGLLPFCFLSVRRISFRNGVAEEHLEAAVDTR